MARKPTEVAEVLFAKCSEVAIENARLKKTVKYIRAKAQEGLSSAAEEGATRWRDALDKIIEATAVSPSR